MKQILWQKIWKYFQPLDRSFLAQDVFIMLHLILCSLARSILSQQRPNSQFFIPLPEHVEVTMIGRRSQNGFKVLAKTRLEVRHIDDPEYGQRFRKATMPYTAAAIFYLTLAHGFFGVCQLLFCQTTIITRLCLGSVIAVVNGLLEFIVPVPALRWIAGIVVLADSNMDYVGFRHNPNINPRIRLFRDLPQVLPAIQFFGAIQDALRI